jgi:hypothetical protein
MARETLKRGAEDMAGGDRSARQAENCAVLGAEIASAWGARSRKYLLPKQGRNSAEKVRFGDDIGVKRET